MASVSLILSRPYTRSSSVCIPCSSISPGATISDCAAAAAPPLEPFENFENLDPPPAPASAAPATAGSDDVDAAPDDEKGFCFSRSAASLAAANGSGLGSPFFLAPGAGDAPAAASSCSCLAAMSACAAFFRWT